MALSSMDRTFAALADPTRRAILARLATGEATVLELAAPFDLSQPAISKHLKVLERAGLVSRSRSAQFRPCRLAAAPLEEVAEWVGTYRRFWDESFDRLGTYLSELQQQTSPRQSRKGKRHGSKKRPPRRKPGV